MHVNVTTQYKEEKNLKKHFHIPENSELYHYDNSRSQKQKRHFKTLLKGAKIFLGEAKKKVGKCDRILQKGFVYSYFQNTLFFL